MVVTLNVTLLRFICTKAVPSSPNSVEQSAAFCVPAIELEDWEADDLIARYGGWRAPWLLPAPNPSG